MTQDPMRPPVVSVWYRMQSDLCCIATSCRVFVTLRGLFARLRALWGVGETRAVPDRHLSAFFPHQPLHYGVVLRASSDL